MAPAKGPKRARKSTSKGSRRSVLLKATVEIPGGAERPPKPTEAQLKRLSECFEKCLLASEVIRTPFNVSRQWMEPKTRSRRTPPKR